MGGGPQTRIQLLSSGGGRCSFTTCMLQRRFLLRSANLQFELLLLVREHHRRAASFAAALAHPVVRYCLSR